jgi:uncharacterized membrane protein
MDWTMLGAYIGMSMVVIAFSLETRGQVSSRSVVYLTSMAVGQILLGARAYDTGEWPFVVLSIIWAGVALLAIVKPRPDE